MPVKKPAIPNLTPGQAQYVLEKAISDRRLTYNDVVSYLARMQGEIQALEAQLEALRAAVPQVRAAQPVAAKPVAAKAAAPKPAAAVAAPPAPRRKAKPITPERRASMKLQGQYLGLLQQIPEAKKASIKKIAQAKGREAAIAQMRATLRK